MEYPEVQTQIFFRDFTSIIFHVRHSIIHYACPLCHSIRVSSYVE